MTFPQELRYSVEHEWVRIDGDTATIGITEFAQSELGDIVYVEAPKIGQTFNAGEIFGSVEAVKTVSDLFIPLSGTVTEINQAVIDKADLLNSDPYGEGWIIRISGFSQQEYEALLSASQYESQAN